MLALRAGRNRDLHAVAGNRGRGRGIIVVIGIRPFEAGQFTVLFFIIELCVQNIHGNFVLFAGGGCAVQLKCRNIRNDADIRRCGIVSCGGPDSGKTRLKLLDDDRTVVLVRAGRRFQLDHVRAALDRPFNVLHVVNIDLLRFQRRGLLAAVVRLVHRFSAGDGDVRVFFHLTASFPLEDDVVRSVRGEGVAEFVDDGSDGIDIAVLVDLSGAAALADRRLRPVAVGNRAPRVGHAADNAAAGISTGNRTSVKTIFNFCTRCTRISENAASVFAARNISRIIAISNGQRTSIHLTHNAANTCRIACACR